MREPDAIFEDQTLRDGLQMEARIFSLEEKLELIRRLAEAGLKRIQVGSFVHPKRVPQMADTDELIRELGERPGVAFTGLVLNEKGLDRALACGLRHVALSVSVSDTHSRKNANRPAREALDAMIDLVAKAAREGLSIRAGLQCAFGCVYEGPTDPEKVLAAAERMAEAGAPEISLADTTGMGHPGQVRDLCRRVADALPGHPVALHLHDTRGLGLANMLAGYEAGVRAFDTCVGGLGGCPFVRGAAGNVPTEDAVHAMEAMGVSTGIRLDRLADIVDLLESALGRSLPGRMARVVRFQRSRADECARKRGAKQ